jgi:hypothetical protein
VPTAPSRPQAQRELVVLLRDRHQDHRLHGAVQRAVVVVLDDPDHAALVAAHRHLPAERLLGRPAERVHGGEVQQRGLGGVGLEGARREAARDQAEAVRLGEVLVGEDEVHAPAVALPQALGHGQEEGELLPGVLEEAEKAVTAGSASRAARGVRPAGALVRRHGTGVDHHEPLAVEAEVAVEHEVVLLHDHERPGDQRDGDGELRDDEPLPQARPAGGGPEIALQHLRRENRERTTAG